MHLDSSSQRAVRSKEQIVTPAVPINFIGRLMNNAIQWCILRLSVVLLVGGALILGNAEANAEASFSCDSQWHEMATANAATQANDYNLLGGVAALSTTDVWAVGIFDQFTQSGYKTLAEHWDGTKWKLVPTPNTSQ